MNIEFLQLELQNFKSVGESIVVDYKQLNGFNYIYGTNNDNIGSKNGSGKSSIFSDGIVFALFGKTLKNTNNQYIPNRNCDKKLESYAKLTFLADKILYRSECRCVGCCQMTLYKYNDELKQWEDITQSSVVKTRQYIQEHILGCSFDIFKSAIIISASDCINFYDGMGKNAKRNYIESIFNLSCFGIMYADVKSDINDIKKELSYINNEIIKSTQSLKNINEKFLSFDKNFKNDLQNLKNTIKIKYENIQKLTIKRNELESTANNEKNNNLELDNLITKEKELNLTKNKLENDINKLQCKIDSINKIIDEITFIKQELCENCKLIVDKRYDYNKQLKSIETLQNLINTNKESLVLLQTNINDNNNQQTEIKKIIKNNETLNNNLYKISIALQSLIDDAKRDATKYKNMQEQTINPYDELLTNTQHSLQDLKFKLKNFSINIEHLEILKEIYSENGVKKIIIKDIVKLLNSLIQKYLNEIGAEYLVYFDESFEFKFITLNGECEYSSFSAGERKRIQIATMFAFRDLILNGKLNSNILVLDEILDDAIDSTAIKNIISILKRKSIETNQNMFIISHRTETTEDNIFDHIIEVIKENGISTLNIS